MKKIILTIYFVVLVFLGYSIVSISNEKQQMRYELAELTAIKYGLFDVDEWKDKMAEIIVKKIDEYEITSENKEYIKGHIEAGFYKLLDELELFLAKEQTKGNWFEQIFKTATFSILFNKESFKSEVPKWADEVMKLIENPNTQNQLKDHLKNRIVKLIHDSKSLHEKTVLNRILAKYSYSTEKKEECKTYISSLIEQSDNKIYIYSAFLLVFCIIPFVIPLLFSTNMDNFIIIKSISLIGLLVLGITIPMLSIDVKIDRFEFILLGEKITFQNQTLYFQSKSILQVVKVLFTSSKFTAIITAILIFSFSIIFPFTKLFCILYESFTNNSTTISDFFVNKSGKWSMADVMVVSIFLSFLGINSLLNDLLKLTESVKEYIMVIPNSNHSYLEIGVVFFISFVILSLFTKPETINKSSKNIFGNTF